MIKKFGGWPVTSKLEQGKMAEERFFEAWSSKKYPPYIVTIDRPTAFEDTCRKTDAVIVQITGPTLKVQIKSYFPTKKNYEELMLYGVVVVWILADDSLKKIRTKTLCAIREFKRFQEERKVHFEKKEKEKKWYFIKGKKRHFIPKKRS